MILCLVIPTANVSTKRIWLTTSFVLRLGVLIMDLLQTKPNMFNASFILKTLPLNSHSPPLTVKPFLVSTQVTVKYIGVHFSFNRLGLLMLIMSSLNALNYLFFIHRLQSMNVHESLLWWIVSTCAIPVVLYYSPTIFTGLLNTDFTFIKKCLRLLSTSSGVAYSRICKVLHSFTLVVSLTRMLTLISEK